MENYENMMFYYHLITDQKNVIKGEYDKRNSKFLFYLMKYKGDSKLEFKIPMNMKQFRFDLCLGIDFKNFLVSMKSNDKEYIKLNRKQTVNIYWNMAHNKKSEVFSEERKKYLITLYDRLDYKIFSDIKRPIRGLIKRCIFNKIYTINLFFEEIQMNQLKSLYLIKEVYKELKNNFKEKISINFISSEIQTNTESEYSVYYEDFIKEINGKLFLKIEELKNFLFTKISEIEKLLFTNFFKNEFSFIVDETFDYEEYEKNSQNSDQLIPINSIMFYNFNKKSESILKIKNSENFLVYMKNKNQSYYFSLKNTSNNNTIKVNKDTDGFMIIFDSIIFSYNSIKKSFYFGEVNNNEEKEGFGFEGIFKKKEEEDEINFYFGDFNNNKYNGNGILDNEKYFYKGNFISGKKSGKCEIYLKQQKEIYVGEIKENILEGKGKYLYNSEPQELLYDGNISSNSPHGKGKIIYKNFDSFEGEFQKSKKIKSGVYSNKIKDSVLIKYDDEGNEKREKTVYKY